MSNRDIFSFLRINDWWHYIVPPILACVYLGIFLSESSLNTVYPSILLLFVSTVGTAGFGFFLNDFADIHSDRIAGKTNSAAKMQPLNRWVLLFVLLTISVLPLIFLIHKHELWFLYALQIALLTAYSLPPFYLKRKAFAGLISDALYSSVIFSALAFFCFFNNFQFHGNLALLLILSVMVLFIKGFRNILLHQVKDYEADMASKVNTYAVKMGSVFCKKLTHSYLFPIELIFLLSILAILFFINSHILPFFIIAAFLYVIIILLLYRLKMYIPEKNSILNNFYEEFLPLNLLVLLCMRDELFIIVIIIHFVSFPKKLLFILLKHYFYHGFIVWSYHKLFTNRYMIRFYSKFRKL